MTAPTLAVIQARMGSQRFPGKMLADLHGRPLVEVVLERSSRARLIDRVVLATSDQPEDDPLAAAAEAGGWDVVRGDRDNVLSRYIQAVETWQPGVVVRLTGDCPCVDAATIDAMLTSFEQASCDYMHNTGTYPDGLDVEVVRAEALRSVVDDGQLNGHHREHVTAFIREHPDRFNIAEYRFEQGDYHREHWSVDHPEDLDFVARLFTAAGGIDASLPALITARAVVHPEQLRRPNEGAIESFLASLEERAPRPVIAESNAWWERSRALIPAGTQTLSKGPDQYVDGFGPKYISRGAGALVWDVDGNRFIDYPMGLGPVTLGHGHPDVVNAVAEHLAQGSSFSMMHPLEVEVAEMVRERVPCADMVRFGKNGSDATTACIRAARAHTGRDHVARCGYHGWQDWSIDRDYGIRARGVPEATLALTHPFAYNDLTSLEVVLQQYECAAVILEPISLESPAPGFLAGVRRLATAYGAVLVFDEVITGFRYARGGAQEYFGVTPDLASMGKGVANGMPLSLVCGRKEVMREFDSIFFSFTFGGETASLAAARATLEVMDREDYWGHVWHQGNALQQAFTDLAQEFGVADSARCLGQAPWTVIVFQDRDRWTGLELKTLFQQEMLRHGVLFSGSQFLCLGHGDEEIRQTIDAYREAFQVLRYALELDAVDAVTIGETNRAIFRRQ